MVRTFRARSFLWVVILIGLVMPFSWPGWPGASAQQSSNLLPVQVSGVDATSNTTQNFTLPAGFVLSGKVTNADGTSVKFGSVTARSGDTVFFAAISSTDSTYRMVLRAGTYSIRALSSAGALTLGFDITSSLVVSGNQTFDILLPAPPRLLTVSGTVTTAGAFLTDDASVEFNSTEGRGFAVAQVLDNKYSVAVPAGTYQVIVDPDVLASIYITTVTVAGNMTLPLMLPPTVKLSGAIRTRSGAGLKDAFVIAQEVARGRSGSQILSDSTDVDGNYEIVLPAGAYEVSASSSDFNTSFPVPPLTVNVVSDQVQDFTRPDLPALVTISGRVTDPTGQPIAVASVTTTTQNLIGAPNVSFGVTGRTGSDGRYSLQVLRGTQYTMEVTPPGAPPGSNVALSRSMNSTASELWWRVYRMLYPDDEVPSTRWWPRAEGELRLTTKHAREKAVATTFSNPRR